MSLRTFQSFSVNKNNPSLCKCFLSRLKTTRMGLPAAWGCTVGVLTGGNPAAKASPGVGGEWKPWGLGWLIRQQTDPAPSCASRSPIHRGLHDLPSVCPHERPLSARTGSGWPSEGPRGPAASGGTSVLCSAPRGDGPLSSLVTQGHGVSSVPPFPPLQTDSPRRWLPEGHVGVRMALRSI